MNEEQAKKEKKNISKSWMFNFIQLESFILTFFSSLAIPLIIRNWLFRYKIPSIYF